jgi:diacylglycerol kinase (ATP)
MNPRSWTLDPLRKRVAILANPRAGSGSSRDQVEELVTALRGRGLQPVVCWHRAEFSGLVNGPQRPELRCAVAAGGDGTLVEVLNRAPGLPVALLPLGTENLVARYWDVERSGRQAAQVIAAGRVRQLDLGQLTRPTEAGPGSPQARRLFCLMAGFGFDADVVHRLHSHRRGHINQFSYTWPIVQALRRYRFPPITAQVLDSGEEFRGCLLWVFNLPRYAAGLPVAPEARGDDGWLDLLVFERGGIFNLFRYLTNTLRGRRNKVRDFHHRRVRAVRLEAAHAVRVQTDGDPAGLLPLTVEVVPAALALVVPAAEART